jgi:hypothetical protein
VTVWTAEGTTNVWKATVAHELTGTDRLRVYEDGVLMTRVANAVTCGSTATSFVDLQSVAGTPWTVKIHATADGNPNSNGKVYRVTVRGYGVIVNDNGAITSIRAQRVISNNGAIEAHANATIKKCLAVDGSKHNLLIGAGTLEDCIACRQDGTTSYEPSATLFVGFSNITTGLTHTVRRCGAHCRPRQHDRRGVGLDTALERGVDLLVVYRRAALVREELGRLEPQRLHRHHQRHLHRRLQLAHELHLGRRHHQLPDDAAVCERAEQLPACRYHFRRPIDDNH